MASVYDVQQQKLVEELAKELEKSVEIKAPEWGQFVKTGTHKQRPPVQTNWWHIRAASVLKQIYKNGPVGVSKLRMRYGGAKNRGVKKHRATRASGNILRKVLQQLEAANLVKKSTDEVHKGRVIAPAGQALLDKTATKLRAPHPPLGTLPNQNKGAKE